ncbi:VanZ family protein [Clostridium sp. DL1XJH146]
MPLSIRIKDSNFIPMKTILYYLGGNQSFGVAKSNILGNIIAFGPFGFLLPIIIDKIKRVKSVVIFSLILSLTFELVQLFANLGEFDIDDILLNTLGAICGYMIFKGFAYLIYKKKNCDVKSLM